MSNRSDQVFPVSLSEIAFILIFLLILLLGFMYMQERQVREQAQTELGRAVQTATLESATDSFNTAQRALEGALKQGGVRDPAEIVQAVLKSGEVQASHQRLQREVIDLTKKLVALEELRAKIEQAGRDKDAEITREQVEQALALKQEVEKALAAAGAKGSRAIHAQQSMEAATEFRKEVKEKLGWNVEPGKEKEFVKRTVDAAKQALDGQKSGTTMAERMKQLEGQVQYFVNRDKLRGVDHPPCWLDEASIEYAFHVQTTPRGFVVTRRWPDRRDADARAIGGLDVLMVASGEPLDLERFRRGSKSFLDYGKKQSPECRHFVYLTTTIQDADQRDLARRHVGSYFYYAERQPPAN